MATRHTFKQHFQRSSRLNETSLAIIMNLTSLPKLVIESFIRSNMGERYFSRFTALMIALTLFALPSIPAVNYLFNGGYSNSMMPFITWYIFAAAFLGFSIKRWLEIRNGPSAFDLEKYSLYSGDILPFYYNLIYKLGLSEKTNAKLLVGWDTRRIEIYLEPASFFIPGVLLILMGQMVGFLIMFCSICYWMNSAICYKFGDDFILDTLDSMIINEEMSAFSSGKHESNTKGFRLQARKPSSEAIREKVVDAWQKEGFERVR